jgi:hypothetical protein
MVLTSFSSSLRSCQYQLNWPSVPSVFNVHQSHMQIILQRHQLCCCYSYIRDDLLSPQDKRIARSHLSCMCKPPFHQLLQPLLVSCCGCCLGVRVQAPEFMCVAFVVFKLSYGIHSNQEVERVLSDGKISNDLLYKSGCD